MSNPTTASFDQAYQMLNLAREVGVSLKTLQALFATGLLADLLKAGNPAAVDRERFRTLLGFGPSVFRVKMGGFETTDDIVAHLKANSFSYVNDLVTQKNFPLVARTAIEEDEIEIVDPSCSFVEEKGLKFLANAKLNRPTYQHALRFAREHGTATTSIKKPFVIFLHEPWLRPNRSPRVMCVDRRHSCRLLDLFYADVKFRGDCVLAGVRPRKQPQA